jgi:hypothetical protein
MMSNLYFSYSRFSSSHATEDVGVISHSKFPRHPNCKLQSYSCHSCRSIPVLVILGNIELINRVYSLQEKRRMRIASLAIHKVKMSAR